MADEFAGFNPAPAEQPADEFAGFQAAPPTYKPTDVPTGENFTAGVGKSFVDTGDSAYHLGAVIGHAMGLVSDEKMAQIQDARKERERLDQSLMSTVAGNVGVAAGDAAQLAAAPAAAGSSLAELGAPVARSVASGAATATRAAAGAAKTVAQAAAPYTDKLAKVGQILGGLALAKHYLLGSGEKESGGSASEIQKRLQELHELVTKYGEGE